MINPDQNKNLTAPAFLRLGFRPFFFIAGLFSAVLMILWIVFYQAYLPVANTSPSDWHAHEMIFGYSAAVIVGFLLTASRTWSGIQTVYGKPLLGLLLIWVMGRFLAFIGNQYLVCQAIVDVSFLALSIIAVAEPIIKAKLWKHFLMVGVVLLLTLAHVLYYLGLLGVVTNGNQYGLYSGFYLVIALILIMSRKLIPFFIEKGLGLSATLRNSKIIDITSIVLFLIFMISEILFNTIISNILSGVLFVMHILRAFWWFDKRIWGNPLLWSIYSAYCFLILGFGIKFLTLFVFITPNIDIHAFAFGIGLMSLAMMSRISLGHTGRNIHKPPKILNIIFILLVISFVFRVVMPASMPLYYAHWIYISQILWVISFLIFTWVYAPILFKSRIDGEFG